MGLRLLLLRYPSQNFIHHMWMWYQPLPRLHSSTSLDGCGSFNSVIAGLPFNSMVLSDGWFVV